MTIAQLLLAAADAGGGGGDVIDVTISTTQTSQVNLFTLAGSPTNVVTVNLTINGGVVLQRGLIQGTGWDPASVCNIDNNGTIAGLGGRGRSGGDSYWIGSWYNDDGVDADDGGDAIDIQMDTTIDNGSGYIFGGGGGGGSGAARSADNPGTSGSFSAGGGGGGGGQGYNNAAGGDRGRGNTDNATAGTAGSSAGNGSGGSGGSSGFEDGGVGGNGGTWGLPGSVAGTGAGTNYVTGRGSRGAAGYAVRKNGFTVTITAGNNSSQIKGSVA